MKHKNYNTIREWGFTLLVASVIAVLMVGAFFGAALQEQDRIGAMTAMEVQG